MIAALVPIHGVRAFLFVDMYSLFDPLEKRYGSMLITFGPVDHMFLLIIGIQIVCQLNLLGFSRIVSVSAWNSLPCDVKSTDI